MTVQLPVEPTGAANPSRSADASARGHLTPLAGRVPGIDCVYMLMFAGWEQELRANRWHYASRWAKHLPVVLVQPSMNSSGSRSVAETRIPNCRVLHVAAAPYAPGYFADSERQTAQILDDMRQHGNARPLLWLYNPQLVASYAAVPAVCRLFHATENYFQFAWSTEFFLQQTRAALRISDLAVTVSGGVAESIAEEVPATPLHTVTNGCDYACYASGTPDASLFAERDRFERIAVYAGNINWRLDFRLMARCANAYPRTLFAIYGPVVGLVGHDRKDWAAVCRLPNVRHYPPVEAEMLPGLYAAADVGFVPYKDDPWIVCNGFPLKVLEMCAAGLPVVCTMMKPIENLATAVIVCGDAERFVNALGQRSRPGLSASECEEMRHICSRNDYDRKFDEVASLVAEVAGRVAAPSCRREEILSVLPVVDGARARLHALLRSAVNIVPHDLRGRFPPGARRVLRNWLER